VLVSVYYNHRVVVSLQVLETSPYRGGAVEFFTDNTIFLYIDVLPTSPYNRISQTT
jgi:hypothetical protein